MRSGGWKKSKKSIKVESGFFFVEGGIFQKIGKPNFTFIREMRVSQTQLNRGNFI